MSADVPSLSRRGLVIAVAGAAAAEWAIRAEVATAATATDTEILNFALLLEDMQASFYTEAEQAGTLRGDARTAARTIGAVERAHVRALRRALGADARPRPFFDFQGTTEDPRAFLRTAVALEDLAVAAYKGQAPRLRSPELLAAAIGIHSVEARHAAWIRYLVGSNPAESAFDEARTQDETLALVRATRFVARRPATSRPGEAPRYSG